jgi:hypothetical protein
VGKLQFPKPVPVNLKRWAALHPDSAAVTNQVVVTDLTIEDLLDGLQQTMESRADAYDDLGPANGTVGNVTVADLYDHVRDVATMRHLLRSDHAMRAALVILEDIHNERNSGLTTNHLGAVKNMLAEAIQPSVSRGSAYHDYLAIEKASRELDRKARKTRKAVKP